MKLVIQYVINIFFPSTTIPPPPVEPTGTTRVKVTSFSTNKDNTDAVVAGVVVPLIVVAVIVVVAVFYIRRRNRDNAADSEDVPMNSKPSGIGELFFRKVAKRFLGIRDFPYLKHGIPGPVSDFKRNRGEIWDWKYTPEVGCRNWITIGITIITRLAPKRPLFVTNTG